MHRDEFMPRTSYEGRSQGRSLAYIILLRDPSGGRKQEKGWKRGMKTMDRITASKRRRICSVIRWDRKALMDLTWIGKEDIGIDEMVRLARVVQGGWESA
jgi:hypothetical protein